ncbi:MAG: YlxM family DNA-binding protein [Christensenellales bacterium]|jgi:predicted DNA-binding protein YlxM (UPF0122 family)
MENKVRGSLLLAVYGPVLTRRQQEIMTLYLDDDLSLAEIAQMHGVSRQGVHDTIRRAQHVLDELEEKLGFAAKYLRFQALAQEQRKMIGEDASAVLDKMLALWEDE